MAASSRSAKVSSRQWGFRAASETAAGFLLYFAALGAGFIVVEVVLVQKCVLFLGHPAYALTVVLFSILLFSGIGSRMSGRFPVGELPRALQRDLVAVPVLIVLYVLGLGPLFYGLVHLESAWRIPIAVLALAPLGLALGMPMPTRIRLLAERAPELIPWPWGVQRGHVRAGIRGSRGAGDGHGLRPSSPGCGGALPDRARVRVPGGRGLGGGAPGLGAG